jgi:hypothetical protein
MNLKRRYKQDITVWFLTGGDDGFGKDNVGPPVSFRGRWEDKQELFRDARGEQVVSKAAIYFPQDSELPITNETWIFKGLTTQPDPRVLIGAYQVRIVSLTPDIRNLIQEQVAMI